MPFTGGHIFSHMEIGPDFVNCPSESSRNNNGIAPNISIVVYGMRNTPGNCNCLK